MPQLIAILAANPLAGVAGCLVGLSIALCGYLGHTRPIRSAGPAGLGGALGCGIFEMAGNNNPASP